MTTPENNWTRLCQMLYEAHGQNYSAAATAAGIPTSYFWRQLNGKGVESPRKEMLEKVSRALKSPAPLDPIQRVMEAVEDEYSEKPSRKRAFIIWFNLQPETVRECHYTLARGAGWKDPEYHLLLTYPKAQA